MLELRAAVLTSGAPSPSNKAEKTPPRSGSGQMDACPLKPPWLARGRDHGGHPDQRQLISPAQAPFAITWATLRSANAAMVSVGFTVPAEPGISAPSTTYRPGWPAMRP